MDFFSTLFTPKEYLKTRVSSSIFSKYLNKNLSKSTDSDVLSLENLKDYKNENQQDKRNYLVLRVFSKKFEHEIVHNTMQKEALAGESSLSP